MTQRHILVTAALPYANGDLHLGHIIEQIQADTWVRFQRLKGNNCYYICGDDAHGTPIMLLAEKLGQSPESLIQKFYDNHSKDAQDFLISFDSFYTTHSEENKKLATTIYDRLKARGDISTQKIMQAFDPVKNIFLPDRFVKGTCPRCNEPDQYGDNCEKCGAAYSPLDLKEPKSVLSGATPIAKESEHYFFELTHFEAFLKSWLQADEHVPSAVRNKLNEWFEQGLKAWDISRDAPYFGFKIPGTEDKYFYVWLDAPIGYMASFQKLCEREKISFDQYWQEHSTTELYHFIGKDIVYFHSLFWPAMLYGSGFRTPTGIFVHGYLTINGQKMSKSRGTFIKARTYLNHLPAEFLRYYFASKLNDSVEDIDLNFDDFRQKINADLVGKLVNIASRCASFINKHFENKLAEKLDNDALFSQFHQQSEAISKAYESRDYSKAMRLIMELADIANQYVDQQKPWALMKDAANRDKVQRICTQALNHFKQLIIYLKPVLPKLAQQSESFLNCTDLNWKDIFSPLLNHTINVYQPLFNRIEEQNMTGLQQEIQQEAQAAAPAPQPTTAPETNAAKPHISIEDFMKVDLRVAKVVNAEAVPEADKLIKLQLDIGEEKPRQVFAGIKKSFNPEELIGKMVVMVANLAPRKMRFGMSEGMVVVASKEGGEQLFLVEPQNGAEPGMVVK